ncbi:heavy-metal-associated domain-containing protein [Thalassospira lucentensis]|uniref:heavy-metal-associated domain-containing protein n=1 Tax=Thalassospira lucentensis TaxID=168935 RepID=UPI0003B40447|nr:heavy-metal-associated domain-containing protein [Thalassospira lucentensis]RCK23788.1 heavy metal transporter [Thalassospira lucentensis MCCC 1A00383 = DSM 14000]
MKRTDIIVAGAFALGLAVMHPGGLLPTAAQAASVTSQDEKTTVFDIENITCALCPVTVKTAMEAVTGVATVDVNFDKKTATVTFDPSVANVETIGIASTNAGYPAKARD